MFLTKEYRKTQVDADTMMFLRLRCGQDLEVVKGLPRFVASKYCLGFLAYKSGIRDRDYCNWKAPCCSKQKFTTVGQSHPIHSSYNASHFHHYYSHTLHRTSPPTSPLQSHVIPPIQLNTAIAPHNSSSSQYHATSSPPLIQPFPQTTPTTTQATKQRHGNLYHSVVRKLKKGKVSQAFSKHYLSPITLCGLPLL